VLAQRLVRTLCPHCKQPYTPDKADIPADFPMEQVTAAKPLFRAVGCRECRQVGYSGRVGIFELLVTTEKIRELSQQRASTWHITQAAAEQGMRNLRDDGWLKVLSGRTTIEEVARVTKGSIAMKR
jgi:type II secretory ATPase GspE/PulE/Tfp pilus assembly ATPase PilB-like protein